MDGKEEEAENPNGATSSHGKLKRVRHVSFDDDVIEADELRRALESIKLDEIQEKRENQQTARESDDNEVFEESTTSTTSPTTTPTTRIDVETSHVGDGDDDEEPHVNFIIEWKTAIKIMVSLMSTFEKILFFLGILSAFFLGLISPYVIYAYGSLIEAFIVHARLLKNQISNSNATQTPITELATTLTTIVYEMTNQTIDLNQTDVSTLEEDYDNGTPNIGINLDTGAVVKDNRDHATIM